MALKKLEIQGYKNDGFSAKNGQAFVVMINPSSYKHDYTLSYNEVDIPGKSAKSLKFKSVGMETISFDFILDDTGVIEKVAPNKGKTVPQMIKVLNKAVYKYYGKMHEPNYVTVTWGSLLFKCRLESMNIQYQMFKPDGDPLRAKITLSFKSYIAPSNESKKADRNSPDMTHIVTVADGDTLPGLCNEIYRNSKYYIKVAKFNKLNSFRNLKPGQKLYFPPLN